MRILYEVDYNHCSIYWRHEVLCYQKFLVGKYAFRFPLVTPLLLTRNA